MKYQVGDTFKIVDITCEEDIRNMFWTITCMSICDVGEVVDAIEKESGYTLVVSKEYLLQACRKVSSVEKIKRRMEWLRPWN